MTAKADPGAMIGGGEDFAEAYDRLADSGRYQTSMEPVAIEPREPPSPPPAWLEWLGELLGSTAGLLELVMWLAVGAIALLIVYLLARRIGDALAERRAKAAGAAGEDDEWRPEAGRARALLDEAEALAERGRFAEAAHLLLFRSLEDIRAKLPDFLRPALTSRDIARAEALPRQARSAFSSIAEVVERGLFATRPVDRDAWMGARMAYEKFAFGGSWA